ncbi:MAG: endolytic transglycosylase MltG [Candidatus Pacebacteria bacterium]|nr:endolytic transglycosylase MltG [Candidatus Paceibacterota bacterium]
MESTTVELKKRGSFWIKVVALGCVFFLLCYLLWPNGAPYQKYEQYFSAENATPKQIADELYTKGYLKNRLSYFTLLIQNEILKGIKTGGYFLSASMNVASIYDSLSHPEYKSITIAEGLRKEEIAQIYQKNLNWTDAETETFAESRACYADDSEGYLFPSTYYVAIDSKPEEVKEQMKKRFEETVGSPIGSKDQGILNLDTTITIASIIQRESGGKKDMNLISGIIWNRIFDNMALDIDATLQYAKGNDGKWWPKVKPEDKYINSPYNTYQNKGLPPGAISNPGLAAIDAARNPEDTDCLFYLHDKNRKIHCSKTYEQHLAKIKIYLK